MKNNESLEEIVNMFGILIAVIVWIIYGWKWAIVSFIAIVVAYKLLYIFINRKKL